MACKQNAQHSPFDIQLWSGVYAFRGVWNHLSITQLLNFHVLYAMSGTCTVQCRNNWPKIHVWHMSRWIAQMDLHIWHAHQIQYKYNKQTGYVTCCTTKICLSKSVICLSFIIITKSLNKIHHEKRKIHYLCILNTQISKVSVSIAITLSSLAYVMKTMTCSFHH